MTAERRKRSNRIHGQFSPRLIDMLESPAYRVLSLSAHRVISRIEIEHASHGGTENGKLVVTKEQFIDYGISHDQVAPAIREAAALGFIKITKRGRGGNAEFRAPHRFFLTFAHSRERRGDPPSHDWRRITSLDEALSVAKAARRAKDETAVRRGKQLAAKREIQSRKVGPISSPKTGTEEVVLPDRKPGLPV
jgi:hypothetical protein